MAWHGLDILTALMDGPKLTRQLSAQGGVGADTLRRCLRNLAAKGLLASCEGIHEITPKGREAVAVGREMTSGPCSGNALSRKDDSLRARAWRVMGMRDFFSLTDLLTTLCTEENKMDANNLRSYLGALVRAGYLLRVAKCGENRYRLRRERNTGPEAPAWNKQARTLRDVNTGQVYPIPARGRA